MRTRVRFPPPPPPTLGDLVANRPQPAATDRDPVDAYRDGIDVTLIDKNLGLSVEERFLQLMELHRLASELHRSTRGSGAE